MLDFKTLRKYLIYLTKSSEHLYFLESHFGLCEDSNNITQPLIIKASIIADLKVHLLFNDKTFEIDLKNKEFHYNKPKTNIIDKKQTVSITKRDLFKYYCKEDIKKKKEINDNTIISYLPVKMKLSIKSVEIFQYNQILC